MALVNAEEQLARLTEPGNSEAALPARRYMTSPDIHYKYCSVLPIDPQTSGLTAYRESSAVVTYIGLDRTVL